MRVIVSLILSVEPDDTHSGANSVVSASQRITTIRCVEPDDSHIGSNSMVSASHRIANSVCSHAIDVFPAPRAREE